MQYRIKNIMIQIYTVNHMYIIYNYNHLFANLSHLYTVPNGHAINSIVEVELRSAVHNGTSDQRVHKTCKAKTPPSQNLLQL